MPEIKKVAILGAGAMGAYFASSFQDAPGFSTVLIADGQRLEKLRQEGLVVNGIPYHIPASSPAEITEPADLIIVALKHHQLNEAIQDLGPLVGDSTIFISVMNGLESEETIAACYGMEKVLYAVSVGIDAVRTGNQIVYTKPGIHYFGEALNPTLSPRVLRVQEAFTRAAIQFETPPDMLRMLWWKFMVNVGINQASAVTRAPYGVFCSNPAASALMEALMQEVVTLAAALGVHLTAQDIQDWYPVMRRLSPEGKTSMLQDIEANRKTEVEAFSGRVIALGQSHGVPTPVNLAVYQIIQVLERNLS